MQQFNLHDKSLYFLNTNIYQNSLVSDRMPKYFEWVKDKEGLPSFYTYTNFNEITGQEKELNVIMLESSAIIPDYVKWVSQAYNIMNSIYTHNSILLNMCPNAHWIPGGGIWIGTPFGGGEVAITLKTKNVSFVSSNKSMCHLHGVRYSTHDFIRVKQKTGDYADVDLMGTTETTGFVKAFEYLTDYRFSIIFENFVDDMYFTEKLLNCFATGTIPIYMGARNIEQKFNIDGIIKFVNVMELLNILQELKKFGFEAYYESRLEAVKDNHERCKEYACTEDYMWLNYMEKKYGRRNPTE